MKHILLVEDEELTNYMLTNMLESAGYVVTAAKNGKDALEYLLNLKKNNLSVDLLVTDIQMPELSGLELIDQIQSQKIQIPILAMTGFGDKETVVQLLRKGCNDYIDKPFSKQDFLQRIGDILKKAEEVQKIFHQKTAQFDKEKTDLYREIDSYRIKYENLRSQMDSAITAYHEIVQLNQKNVEIPIYIRSYPLFELGGDFVDIRETSNGCTIFMTDVAGHDLGASYHTILIKSFLDECYRKKVDGVTLFKRLNQHLIKNTKDERMATAIYLNLNLKTMQGEIINAAHPHLIRINAHGIFPIISPQNTILGMYEDASFENFIFPIFPKDRFFMNTDGLINMSRINSKTGNRILLQHQGLIQLLKQYQELSIHDMIERIWQDIQLQYKFNDDILFLGLEIPKRLSEQY